MKQPPPLVPDPPSGMSVAFRAMEDAVSFYWPYGGAAEARRHVDELASSLKFYPDCGDAYQHALRLIANREREEQRQAEERQQKQMRDMVMTLMGTLNKSSDNNVQPTGDKNVANVDGLPSKLTTKEAMKLWQLLQDAQMVDDHYQPHLLSRTESALVAFELCERLHIRNKWKTFERLWHRRNMRNDYNQAYNLQKFPDFMHYLKDVLSGKKSKNKPVDPQ